jgi:D-amino-acid dehydrogenase
MRVVVVGAGVIGVTTAYYLSQAGCEVTVIDRAAEVADGASRANGAQLSYSFTDALANPGFIPQLPALLAGQDSGFRVRLAPALLPWGLRFLSQCTSNRARQNTLAVLQTAMRSATLLTELRQNLPFDFSHRSAGKLVLLSSAESLRSAEASSQLKNAHGCETEILTPGEAIRLEKSIASMATTIVGAVYSRNDEVADAYLFTQGMKEWLENTGAATFVLGSEVERISKRHNRVQSVFVSSEEIAADAIVICTGAWSGKLLQSLGIDPQIYPVRGYSITLPLGEQSPQVSVSALKQRIVFSRINGCMRIAGFADFKGFSTEGDPRRIEMLVNVARSCAPLAADYNAAEQHRWGGFRPMTPDGRPRTGPTSVDGLFLNTGHGMLGWTLACASGYDVAQAVTKSLH